MTLFGIILVSMASITASPPADAAKKEAADPGKMICKRQPQIGSRLAVKKTCLTAAQWEDQRRADQQMLLEKQRNGASGATQ